MPFTQHKTNAHSLQKHPEAKPYHRKPFPLYDKIAELVDGAHTAGNNSLRELTTVSSAASIGPSSIREGPPEDEEMMSDDEVDGGVSSVIAAFRKLSSCTFRQILRTKGGRGKSATLTITSVVA
jgi:hypothetical protein